MVSDPNNPCGRNNEGGMSSYWARLLNLLQHEAGNLVVVLRKRNYNDYDYRYLWSQNSLRFVCFFPKHTHSLFAPGATDGNDLFTVESKLLLETLDKKQGMVNSLHYNKIQLNVKLKCYLYHHLRERNWRGFTINYTARLITHLTTLFTFAFLTSAMHPVVAHHNGLNAHK